MNRLNPETIQERSKFIKKVREFFYEKNFIEVDTPCLVHTPSMEPHLDPYEVNTENGTKYLITSPEYSMKKILSMGCKKIFELSHSFRAKEQGKLHTSEFLMLEWYWVDSNLDELIDMSLEFINSVLNRDFKKKVITLEEWFQRNYHHGIEENELRSNTLLKHLETENMSYEEMFFRLFLPTENKLNSEGLVFLIDYPEALRAYATVKNGKAQRFEIYLNGVEIANAFNEEKSATCLLDIIEEEKRLRKDLKKKVFNLDNDFVNSLTNFNENITGIALGLDRLFAYHQGVDDLCKISFYPQISRG